MLDWVAGAVESAKAMKEIGQSLLTIRDESVIRERVYELNNNLLDLQQRLLEAQLNQVELVQRIRALEDEKQQANQSISLKDLYRIHTFPTSHHAYVLKSEDGGESTQYFCSRCMEGDAIAVTLHGSKLLSCPKCRYQVRSEPAKPLRVRRVS